MARDVMILMWENALQGPLEGVGPENQDFVGPEMATSKTITRGLAMDLPPSGGGGGAVCRMNSEL